MIIMRLALELHTTEEDIRSWDPDKFASWVAFFKIRDADNNKRVQSMKAKARRKR